MCRHLHPEEDEEVVSAGVEAEQQDLEAATAEAAERAEGRLAATRAEIANAMAELADARAELAEARAAIAAPPADFETLAGDAQRRQAWLAEEEAHSYAIAMARGLMCSDLDSLQRRGPSPARVEQENRELADAAADVEAAQAATALAEAASSLARRVQVALAQAEALWDSSLAEALERRRRQDEMSVRRRARRAECKKRSRFDDGAGPSGGQ
ncbi:hypothetical protein QYE76_058387 [Lolium multiflorum]|uniref:Uncharacterized protein n=1 Tax=Lolium multiflorum TaxID=4521 RepID=A0AAD8T5E7_LOLMU|nr:hypothetical protein QYE76_058387 [Lolium multiflorum]